MEVTKEELELLEDWFRGKIEPIIEDYLIRNGYKKELEMKPCPFCGNPDIAVTVKSNGDRNCYCNKCATYGPWSANRHEAISYWNKRA